MERVINAEDILKLKEAIGERPFPGRITVIENQYMSDDVVLVLVSSRLFKELKKTHPDESKPVEK